MDIEQIVSYIKDNDISTYLLADMTGINQSVIYRNIYNNARMSAGTYIKLSEAVKKIKTDNAEKDQLKHYDENPVNVLREDVTEFKYDRSDILRDQAEALKMSSEHIGKLLEQIARQMDRIEQLEAKVRELEGK